MKSENENRAVGKQAIVTGGRHRGKQGVIIKLERTGVTIRTDSGEEIRTGTPWINIIDETNSDDLAKVISSSKVEKSADTNPDPNECEATNPQLANAHVLPLDYETLTLNELRKLAQQNGISVTRKKKELIALIAALEPDLDQENLRGKALLAKIAEHHISRLRSKHELATLVAATIRE